MGIRHPRRFVVWRPGADNAGLQALIPSNIQKARFNLYPVYNDGSRGVHNPLYTP